MLQLLFSLEHSKAHKLFCLIKKALSKNIIYYFLLFCGFFLSFFVILGGSFSIAFSEHVGILCMMSSFAYRSSFKKWIQKWVFIQLFPFIVLILFKDSSFLWPLDQFVRHFSFTFTVVALGLVVVWLNEDRFTALKKNQALQKEILEQKIQENILIENRLVFARQIAHDLKAPLAVLKLLLLKSDLDKDFSFYSEENRRLLTQVVLRIQKINLSLFCGDGNSDLEKLKQETNFSSQMNRL